VEAVKSKRRVTWIQLSQHAQVIGLEGTSLTVGFNNAGARESFVNGGGGLILQQVLIDLVGHDWKIDAILDPSVQPGTEPTHTVTRPSVTTSSSAGPGETPSAGGGGGPVQDGGPSVEPLREPPPEDVDEHDSPLRTQSDNQSGNQPGNRPRAQDGPQPGDEPRRSVDRSALRRATAAADERPDANGPSAQRSSVATATADEDAHRDDPDVDDVLDGAQLLSQRLGAQVIEEIPHD
jgi:DNA polymerase-3 subunit gamma/tau